MKKNRIFILSVIFGAVVLAIFGTLRAEISEDLEIYQKTLRLHIPANSDTKEDQELKLKVRDAVLACGVGRVPTPEEMRKVQKAAEECMRMHGFEESVQVEYRRMYFETRTYDTFALPAGYYQALRVTIGEGRGANWWCVVYPPLCFTGGERGYYYKSNILDIINDFFKKEK